MGDQASTSSLRVLITEDHPDTARVMKMLLERHGMTVHTAGTMAEACGLSEEEKFDLLIADMRLPDGNGFELNRAIRQKQNVKSICLSGDPVSAADQTVPDSDFTAYLTKPIDLSKLLETIRQITADGSSDSG